VNKDLNEEAEHNDKNYTNTDTTNTNSTNTNSTNTNSTNTNSTNTNSTNTNSTEISSEVIEEPRDFDQNLRVIRETWAKKYTLNKKEAKSEYVPGEVNFNFEFGNEINEDEEEEEDDDEDLRRNLIRGSKEFIESYLCPATVDAMKEIEKLDKQLVSNEIKECPVCMNETQLVALECSHDLCIKCLREIQSIDLNKAGNRCPQCRKTLGLKNELDMYALLVLCEETHLYNFHNGGYKSIGVLYYPSLEEKTHAFFENVLYNEFDNNKIKLVNALKEINAKGYTLGICHYRDTLEWAKNVELDILKDMRYEKII
jgi:hypothetical protein